MTDSLGTQALRYLADACELPVESDTDLSLLDRDTVTVMEAVAAIKAALASAPAQPEQEDNYLTRGAEELAAEIKSLAAQPVDEDEVEDRKWANDLWHNITSGGDIDEIVAFLGRHRLATRPPASGVAEENDIATLRAEIARLKSHLVVESQRP